MSVAWALNAWATNSWVGMNAGPPNAWRGASTPIPPTPVVPTTDQASNWQADYWKHGSRSKQKRREDDEEERIRLGILPPAEREQADEAVAVVVSANAALQAKRITDSEAVLAKMDAREQYEQAYKAAYQEAYVASVVAEHWKEDLRIATRRRKAVLLLLH